MKANAQSQLLGQRRNRNGGGQAQLGLDLINLLDDFLLYVKEEVLEDFDSRLSNLLEDEPSNGDHGQASVVELLGLEHLQFLLISGLQA